MSIKTKTFAAIASRYAGILGRKRNAQVLFGGAVPCTDGARVVIPQLPPGTVLTQHQAKLFGGYLDHEIGHVRWTTFPPPFASAVDSGKMERTEAGIKHQLWNIFEDVRMENAQIKEYPGTKEYLDAVGEDCNRGLEKIYGQLKLHNRQPDRYIHMMGVLIKECYNKYRGTKFAYPPGEIKDHSLLKTVEKLLDEKMPKLKTSQDCAMLATEVFDVLKIELEKTKEEPLQVPGEGARGEGKAMQVKGVKGKAGESGRGDEKGDKESGAGAGDLKGKETKGESKGNEAEQMSGEGDSDGDAEGGQNREGSFEQKPTMRSGGHQQGSGSDQMPADLEKLLKVVKEALEEAFEQFDKQGGLKEFLKQVREENEKEEAKAKLPSLNTEGKLALPPVSTEYDQIFTKVRGSMSEFKRVRDCIGNEIATLKKSLRLYLQSRDRRATSRGLEEGDVDYQALAALRTGNGRVYKEKRDRDYPNVAVEVMVDFSGSMNEKMTRQAMILLAEAVQGSPKIKLQVNTFTTNHSKVTYSGEGRGQGRSQALDIKTLKAFDESYAKACKGFGEPITQGNTPLGDAYGWGLEALLSRQEKRRILFLITDGEPYVYVADSRHSEYEVMRKAQRKCKVRGIETIGLEIGRKGFLKLYVDKSVLIKTIVEMPAAVLDVMREVVR